VPVGMTDHVRDLRLVGPDGKVGAARSIHRRALSRRDIFHKTRNCCPQQRGWSSRCNSTPWRKKASTSRFFTPAGD
jgi:hypothetical protein